MIAPIYTRTTSLSNNNEISSYGVNGIVLGKIGDSHIQLLAKIESTETIVPKILAIKDEKLVVVLFSENRAK
ncbi:MAG: hypothetical protein LBD17_03970 [Endomicrobium sp.]|jgi:hypothetical protein|nr:hypothetical protein [Endomicrobium sp.]